MSGHAQGILSRFNKWSAEDRETGCVVWNGAINTSGYGAFRLDQKTLLAHRAAYAHFVGPVPDGMTLDHLCRNRRCINPAHLEPVTSRENIARANAARTHCKRGHAFDAENTYLWKGWRHCRKCSAIHSDANKARGQS